MEARLPEHLKDICQKQHVCPAVQVAVVAQGLAPKGFPDLLRMGVVLVADMRIREFAVEGFFWREFGFGKAVPVVHVLVGVHALAQQELPSFSVGLVLGCYPEGLWRVRRHQLFKGG